MSNQEAIALLRNLEDVLDSYCELNEEGKTAFRMAIEALSSSEIPNSSDTISRAKAIEALKNDMASLDHIIKGMSANDVRLDAYVSQRNQVNYDIYTINNLPPAQLSTNLAEVGTDCISRQVAISAICSACGKIDCDKMDKCEKLQLPPANCSETPNSSDTISRQAVKEILDKNQMPYHVYPYVWDAINALPPAQPEPLQPWEVLAAQAVLSQPKLGKWIYHIDDLFPAESTMECNQCHAEQPLTCDDEFCPHCGAKMEVTE